LGIYDEDFVYAEDLELWMRLGQKYELHNIQQFLVDYRIFGGNNVLIRQKAMINNTLRARQKAWREYGYQINFKGCIFYVGTWLAQWLPPQFVFWIFNKFKKK
jgi:hypothetical protein